MPGYVVHLAVAQEYLRKHKEKYSQEFMEGTVAPDFTLDKSKTHYGKSPAYTNLKNFLENNKIDTDYDRGFFLHLITDYLFYNKYLDKFEKPQIYDDYDYTNKELVEKYNITIIDKVKDKIYFKEGTPKILTLELACKVIDEVSKLNLVEVEKEVKKDDTEWSKYKELI